MAFHLVLTACILLYLHGATIVFATSNFNLYTDSSCQDLYANVQTHTNAGDGDCGQANGTYSASVSSLDSGCYLTIYSDFCSSNPTAVRIGQCTILQNSIEIATFSVDCPQNNGVLDGYTTSLAAAARTSSQSPTSFESTTPIQEPEQVPITSIQSSTQEPPQDSIISTPSPSSSGSTSSSQEPQQVPTTSTQSSSSSSTSDSLTPEFSSSSSKELQQTSSPASPSSTTSPSPTTASDPSSKTPPPSSSAARSSPGNDTKGGIGKNDTIIAYVFGSLGFKATVVSGTWFIQYRKRKQRARKPNPQNVASRTANDDDRPAMHSLLSGSTARRSSQDLGPQPSKNGEPDCDVSSEQSGFESRPTAAQVHPPFSSMS